MKRALAPIAALTALVASTALAAPADPMTVDSPRADQKVELGSRFEIRPGHQLNAKKYDCTVTQGSTVWKSGDQPGPHCELTKADQAKFKAGPATITVRAFLKNAWLPAAKVNVELTAPAPCSGPKCSNEGVASASPAGRPAAAGIKVGTDQPASWDSHYTGNGRTVQLLWCPGLWEMQYFDVKDGEAKFEVWLGAVGATGQPKKAPAHDPGSNIVVTAKINADGTVAGGATFGAETLAWGKAHPESFPAGATGLAFKGKVQNDNNESTFTYDMGRTFSGTATATGGAAGSCELAATASDYKHILNAHGREAIAEASKPRAAGKSCIFDNECQSGVCIRSASPREMNKCG